MRAFNPSNMEFYEYEPTDPNDISGYDQVNNIGTGTSTFTPSFTQWTGQCSDTAHYFACPHANVCKCGQVARMLKPACPVCGKEA